MLPLSGVGMGAPTLDELCSWSGAAVRGVPEEQCMLLHLHSFPGLSGQTELISDGILGSGLTLYWLLSAGSAYSKIFSVFCNDTDYCSYSIQLLTIPTLWLMILEIAPSAEENRCLPLHYIRSHHFSKHNPAFSRNLTDFGKLEGRQVSQQQLAAQPTEVLTVLGLPTRTPHCSPDLAICGWHSPGSLGGSSGLQSLHFIKGSFCLVKHK